MYMYTVHIHEASVTKSISVVLLPQVDYDNHPHFKSKQMKGSKRGSPVRIFTNINPADVVLPSAEGYRYVVFNLSDVLFNVQISF